MLVKRYLDYVVLRYRHKDGAQTGHAEAMKYGTKMLVKEYGDVLIGDFGTKALIALQNKMVQSGLARNTIDNRIDRIRAVFKWGVLDEMVTDEQYRRLLAVPKLDPNDPDVKETKDVESAPASSVIAAIKVAHKTIGDMLRLQMLSGARQVEVRRLRPCDIDKSDPAFSDSAVLSGG